LLAAGLLGPGDAQVGGRDRAFRGEGQGAQTGPRPGARERLTARAPHRSSVPRFVTGRPAGGFPGLPLHTPAAPELLHQMEDRDPHWAPAMEAAISGVFLSRDALAGLGLGELEVTGLDCRQTTCQLSYQYPLRLVDRVVASGLPASSPMVLVEEAIGWAAPRGGGLHTRTFPHNGEGYASVSLVLVFDDRSWDPARYRQWVEEQRPAAQEFFRRARAARRDQRAYQDAG
jgi:hypothetical protein